MIQNLKNWFSYGVPYIWLNAGAVSLSIIMVFGLIVYIAVNGLQHFWPKAILQFDYQETDGNIIRIIGELADQESVLTSHLTESDLWQVSPENASIRRFLIKTGNRDFLDLDFRWILEPAILSNSMPDALMAVERREWGNLYGYLISVKKNGEEIKKSDSVWKIFQQEIIEATEIFQEIRYIEKDIIGEVNYKMEKLRLQQRRLELNGVVDAQAHFMIEEETALLQAEYNKQIIRLEILYQHLNQVSFVARLSDGQKVEIALSNVVRAYRPNAMSLFAKIVFYFEKLWEFASDDPREANTEGGIFPAIFGTVMMVMVMAILVAPFGVITAVYLREYAKQGPLTRLIRIAVNNLAGVPSIVYGVFGLGFFIYFIGGSIDELFFREGLPTPTFGTPGLIWASLTLAILTVPVVIVSTEEGLSRVPRSIREGSLALGATKAETLWRTVLPMTAPAMMTGLILAVARAAGEVAPLMLVGVVKLAPSLPLDGNAPYFHLDRKFMHLGFHIYDVGFQSPNVEAARPLVYATALILVIIIIILNMAAIKIRNSLRVKYRAAEQY